MKQRISSVNNMKRKSCIDEMDELLDQINDFKNLIETTQNMADPNFKQEYLLFKQHVEWAIEDLSAGSYITQNSISQH